MGSLQLQVQKLKLQEKKGIVVENEINLIHVRKTKTKTQKYF